MGSDEEQLASNVRSHSTLSSYCLWFSQNRSSHH